MFFSRYSKIYPSSEDRDSVTLFSTKNTATLLLPSEMVEDIKKGNVEGEEKETLAEHGFLVSSADAEQREMMDFIRDVDNLNKKFHAIVVLDLDCNLACKYCFEGSRKGKFYLSPETADSFINFIKNRDLSNKDEIDLIFYGGEPLLNVESIVHISEEIKAFAEKKALKYTFSFITNGTLLTSKTVERLVPLGLNGASITLDGPREIHNRYRPFRSGKGSFDTIVGNIGDICNIIEIHVGGNYTREHYKEVPRLLDFLLDKGLTPDKIPFMKFDPVVNERSDFAPPDFHDGCISINEPWLFEASVFLRGEVLKRGYRTQKIEPSPCMMQFTDNLVMNYDGTFYKCPGLLGRKDCCVGDLTTGLIDYRESHALDSWKNEECLACSYLPLCFGGCRYLNLVRTGNMKGIDCRKEYFDRTLAQLITQDIKYNL